MHRIPIQHALFIATLGLASLSCRAQRELVITSEPPGAEIRLDGKLIAEKTPAHVPFKDYGVRRISLYHEGYMRYSEVFDVRAPWYARFPIDLLSEFVLPVGWHDRHKLRVKLVRGDTLIAAPDLENSRRLDGIAGGPDARGVVQGAGRRQNGRCERDSAARRGGW